MNNEIKIVNESNMKKKIKGNRPITCLINPNVQNNYNLECNLQSPKIKNNEYRCNSQPKLFSLIDIKSKYHSKGPNLPNQYKRKIYANIDKLLYEKNSDITKIPQTNYDLTETNDNNIKNKSMIKIKGENINKEKKLRKNKSQDNINIDDYRIQSALVSRKERLYKPYYWDNFDIKYLKKGKRDKLMPEGFELYEKNLKELGQNYLSNNYVKIKNKKNENEPILIRKLNRLKQYKSDIFFIKEKEKEKKDEENKNENNIKNNEDKKYININDKINKKKKLYKYNDSDIFNLRKDKNIIEKSGEHSYFKKLEKDETENNKNITYNINNETLLGWRLRGPLPSLYNYTSSKYHLLNRNIKNVGNTKEDVIKESKKISDNFNPINKKKGICEFMDLCRVSAPNINIDYNKAINDNPNIFKRKNDISSEYYDIYNQYNNICDKPFKKFNPIEDY